MVSEPTDIALTTVRTFKMRSGRITPSQRNALEQVAARFDVSSLPWADVVERAAGKEIIADIGFGFGDSILHYGQAEPENFIIGVEVHLPGVGALCREAAAVDAVNIGVVVADARTWLLSSVPQAALSGVRLFFPDPWPKARHHKRRFIRSHVLTLLATRVRTGGFLHIATDWADYADDAREQLQQHPDWVLDAGSHRRADRPITRFERRAIAQGRNVEDVFAVRG